MRENHLRLYTLNYHLAAFHASFLSANSKKSFKAEDLIGEVPSRKTRPPRTAEEMIAAFKKLFPDNRKAMNKKGKK